MSLAPLIQAYENMLERYPQERFLHYLLSFMFHRISPNPTTRLTIMQQEIERFYRRLLTRVVRNPRAAIDPDRIHPRKPLPLLIAVPDAGVLKWQPQRYLPDIRINDGVHYHGLIVLPLESRIKVSLKTHLRDYWSVYCASPSHISRIHAELIEDYDGPVVDYVFKHIKRGSFSLDDVVVLPRSPTEIIDQAPKSPAQPSRTCNRPPRG